MSYDEALAALTEPPLLPIGDFHLRPLRETDAARWSAYLCDARVTLHTSWGATDLATIESIVRRNRAEYGTKASWRWAIARDEDDALVGACGFTTWSTIHRTAELAYDLSPDYWSRGIITRAVDRVVEWGFSAARLNRIQALVLPSNAASITVLERCGFTREGTLRAYRMVRGEPRDYLLYAQVRS